MVRVSLGDSIIDLKRFSVNLGAEYEFISFYFRIEVGKVSAMTALQYINYINNKPIGRIKYALI